MTIADAAYFHQVTERTVRRWIADGHLKSFEIGGVRHVDGCQAEIVAKRMKRRRHARPRLDFVSGLI